jgi:hypothetical protein
MNATIVARMPTSFTLQIEVPYNDSRYLISAPCLFHWGFAE